MGGLDSTGRRGSYPRLTPELPFGSDFDPSFGENLPRLRACTLSLHQDPSPQSSEGPPAFSLSCRRVLHGLPVLLNSKSENRRAQTANACHSRRVGRTTHPLKTASQKPRPHTLLRGQGAVRRGASSRRPPPLAAESLGPAPLSRTLLYHTASASFPLWRGYGSLSILVFTFNSLHQNQ